MALAAAIIAGSGVAVAQDAAVAGSNVVTVVELNSWYRAVLVTREATRYPRDLETLAKSYCEGLEVCRVGIWIDKWTMPYAMPVTARQIEAQEFAFGRNPKGEETSEWNCDKYPEFEAENACQTRILAR